MNNQKGKKIVMWIISTILIAVIAIIVFFHMPYSKTVSEFNTAVNRNMKKTDGVIELISLNDIEHLPKPVQKYFNYCGYIGTKKLPYMKIMIKDATLVSDGKELNTEYLQYNFIAEPVRLALIKSSVAGIPFQGFDSYENGVGSMKGVIGKLFTLFDVKGTKMNQACLVTFLSEALIIPSAALQEYISWTEIDDFHVRATISFYDTSASGIFTFDDKGLVLSFETNDRYFTNPDGTMSRLKWTATFDHYVSNNGILQPTSFKAIWNYPDKDFIYFDANNITLQ